MEGMEKLCRRHVKAAATGDSQGLSQRGTLKRTIIRYATT